MQQANHAPQSAPDLSHHGELMDGVYRLQRHIYDVTRKFFLFGRDSTLNQIELRPESSVLEVGVGTGRNLHILARRYPDARLYGIDPSEEMLKTARKKLRKYSTFLFQAYGEATDLRTICDEPNGFDVILFSYSLSMAAEWEQCLARAIENLKPGGSLYIVDFWDLRTYPRWMRAVLRWWLAKFHVTPRHEILEYLQRATKNRAGELYILPIAGSYSFVATYRKNK